jgi:hypothetical protein
VESATWWSASVPHLQAARSTALLVIFSALALLVPALALASTTLGPVPTNPGPESTIQAINWPDGSLIFTTAGPAGQQLTAPESGTITSWQLYTDEVGAESSVQLRVLSHIEGQEYKVVGSGPVQPIDAVSSAVAKKNALHTFQVSVPIAVGQMVGVTLFKKASPGSLVSLPAVDGMGWGYACLTCGSGSPIADGESASASTIPNQWVALTAEIGGGGGGGEGGCVGSLCAGSPPSGEPGPGVTAKKKCKKGKRLKHGKCVKKHKKKHRHKHQR